MKWNLNPPISPSHLSVQRTAQQLCLLQLCRGSRRRRTELPWRGGRPPTARASPGHDPSPSGPSPMPGRCCEAATRATRWAITLARGRRRTWRWCCLRRWAAPSWTWTRRARSGTAQCRCAVSRAPQREPLSSSWRRSSSLEGKELGLLCRNKKRKDEKYLGRKLLEGFKPGSLFFLLFFF